MRSPIDKLRNCIQVPGEFLNLTRDLMYSLPEFGINKTDLRVFFSMNLKQNNFMQSMVTQFDDGKQVLKK